MFPSCWDLLSERVSSFVSVLDSHCTCRVSAAQLEEGVNSSSDITRSTPGPVSESIHHMKRSIGCQTTKKWGKFVGADWTNGVIDAKNGLLEKDRQGGDANTTRARVNKR